MWAGCPKDACEFLVGRSAGVWLGAVDGHLYIRWNVRKNKPKGCTISRPCTCKKAGRAFCLPCRMRPVLKHAKPGQLLWNYTDAVSLELVKDPLERCQHEEQAAHFTLRGEVDGKAAQLAQGGENCPKLPRYGHVKGSQSTLRYMADEVFDKPNALRVQLNLSHA